MNTSAIVTMAIICGFVWGGFLFLLSFAMRREKARIVSNGPPERQRGMNG